MGRQAPGRVGTKLEGYTHICDWYATFAALAGTDPTDHKAAAAGLPPIDSVNLWPYLSGAESESPRKEVFADPDVIIVGDWKVVGPTCEQVGGACWMGPQYPNGTGDPACSRQEPCGATGG